MARTTNTKTIKESAKTATVTLTRDNFGTFQFSDGVKTVTFNESEAGGLDKLWDVLEATA